MLLCVVVCLCVLFVRVFACLFVIPCVMLYVFVCFDIVRCVRSLRNAIVWFVCDSLCDAVWFVFVMIWCLCMFCVCCV